MIELVLYTFADRFSFHFLVQKHNLTGSKDNGAIYVNYVL